MGEVFIGSEAVAAGTVTEHQLRRWHRPIFRNVYVPRWHEVTLPDRIHGAWLWSHRRAAIAGVAASALHGARWVDLDTPIELIAKNSRPHPGLVVRNETLDGSEITRVRGLPVTTLARTAFDLGRHLPRDRAVARLDALMWASPFLVDDVHTLAERYRGVRGVCRLRAMLPLVDGGAASPKETWLRLLLIDAGFPRPTTQIPLVRDGRLVGLFDMGWKEYRVAMEYDGDYHLTDRRRFVKDIGKLAAAHDQDWIVIRVVSEHRSREIARRAYDALTHRGWRPDRHQRAALSRFLTVTSISA